MSKNPVEIWRNVPGFGGKYEVSSLGRVRSFVRRGGSNFRRDTPILKAVKVKRNGYVEVHLHLDGVTVYRTLHRLVAEAFHGPPPHPDAHAAHLDGNKLNNVWNNVAWATPKQNREHQELLGVTREHRPMPEPRRRAIDILHHAGFSVEEIAVALHLSPRGVQKLLAKAPAREHSANDINRYLNIYSDITPADTPSTRTA